MTTIQLSNKTKGRLDRFKMDQRETYERVIVRLMDYNDQDDYLSKEDLKDIEKAVDDLKAGRAITHEELKKRLGIK